MEKRTKKEVITGFLKYFVKSFIKTFVPTTIVLGLVIFLIMGNNPSTYEEIRLMLKVVGIFCVAAPIVNYIEKGHVEDLNQLTVDNYWKLKKELNNKVNKKGKKKN